MSRGEEPLHMPEGEARLWQTALVLAQELSVARDRIDLLERALAARGVLAAGELEALPLDEEAMAARAAARADLAAQVIRSMKEADGS